LDLVAAQYAIKLCAQALNAAPAWWFKTCVRSAALSNTVPLLVAYKCEIILRARSEPRVRASGT